MRTRPIGSTRLVRIFSATTGLIFNTEDAHLATSPMRPPFFRYSIVSNPASCTILPRTWLTRSRTPRRSNPFSTARAAASTCQPKPIDVARESITSTGTAQSAAAIFALSIDPLNVLLRTRATIDEAPCSTALANALEKSNRVG